MNLEDISEITVDTTVSWLRQPDGWELIVWEATGRYQVTPKGQRRKRSLTLRDLALEGITLPMAFAKGADFIDGIREDAA